MQTWRMRCSVTQNQNTTSVSANLKQVASQGIEEMSRQLLPFKVLKPPVNSVAITWGHQRGVATNLGGKRWTSKEVRKCFLDFFAQSPVGSHTIVPSSSILPRHDPSLTFTNAGMNQFKGVFLGWKQPIAPMVANVQKCIRVGGKHNDLSEVGRDGYHHTFFEMMGNWSFNSYFKQEACSLAWNLLTGPYGLDPERLFVTYFAGSEELGLAPDNETKEYWLSLGVAKERILPFGKKENFWEMGLTGPCGPCTEIHFDYGGRGASGVNKGYDDLVEVWNLVFMQYNMNENGTLEPLKHNYVDTGLGLERLCAILNQMKSNYESDLFLPLINRISTVSGRKEYSRSFQDPNHLDCKYRILADHTRMVAICIGDGLLPDTCHRFKHILHRTLRIAKEDFGLDHKFVHDLCRLVVDNLGEQYNELTRSVDKMALVLEGEVERLREQDSANKKAMAELKSQYPQVNHLVDETEAFNICEALKRSNIVCSQDNIISGDMGIHLTQSFGLTAEQIHTVATIKNVGFDEKAYERNIASIRAASLKKSSISVHSDLASIPSTDSSPVYSYNFSEERSRYEFPVVTAKIIGIFKDGESVKSLQNGEQGCLHLDKTCFFAESGGQVGDIGRMKTENGDTFQVVDCQRVYGSPDKIAHQGSVTFGTICAEATVTLHLAVKHRLLCMQSHSGAHLLNEALHHFIPVTCQRSCHVSPNGFSFSFANFRTPITPSFITKVEERVNHHIGEKMPMKRIMKSLEQVSPDPDAIMLPGAQYPPEVSVIVLPNGRVEPCCGTHVVNTGDIQSFAVIGVKQEGEGTVGLKCVTGEQAISAREKGVKLVMETLQLSDLVSSAIAKDDKDMVQELLTEVKMKKKTIVNGKIIPWVVAQEICATLEDLMRALRSKDRLKSKTGLLEEMRIVLEEGKEQPFIVHFFDNSASTKVNLSKITKICKEKPILLLVKSQDGLLGRAVIPVSMANDSFNAFSWMESVSSALKSRSFAPRGQDRRLICNMAAVPFKSFDDKKLSQVLRQSEQFAVAHMTAASTETSSQGY